MKPQSFSAIIVEDDAFIAIDLQNMLEDLGGNVVDIYTSLEGALRAAKTAEVDLFTLDYDLEDDTSEQVAEILSTRGIPFILVSGKGPILKNIEVFKDIPFLGKPINPKPLERALEKALSES